MALLMSLGGNRGETAGSPSREKVSPAGEKNLYPAVGGYPHKVETMGDENDSGASGAVIPAGLQEHIVETLKRALDAGIEATRAVGSAWGEIAFKAELADRAMKQTMVPPEAYARIAATVFSEASR